MQNNVRVVVRVIEKKLQELRDTVTLEPFFEFGENPEILTKTIEKLRDIEELLQGTVENYFTQASRDPLKRNSYYTMLQSVRDLYEFSLEILRKKYGSVLFTEKFLKLVSDCYASIKPLLAYLGMEIFPYELMLAGLEKELKKLPSDHSAQIKYKALKNQLVESWQAGDQNTLKDQELSLLSELEELSLEISGKKLADLEQEIILSSDADDSIIIPPIQLPKSIDRYWALIMGVGQYDDIDAFGYLPHASKDACEVTRTLLSAPSYNSERINFFVNDIENCPIPVGVKARRPKWNNMETAIKQYAGMASNNDFLLVYFSGHGYLDGKEPYLIAEDTYASRVSGTGISMHKVKNVLQKSNAQVKIIILDTCHSGAMLSGAKSSLEYQEDYIKLVFEGAQGMVILTSCSRNERSFPHHESGLSVFTHFLIDGLKNGKSTGYDFVTVGDLSRHLRSRVGLWALDAGKSQTPRFQIEDAIGDPIMIDWRKPEGKSND